MSKSSVDNLAVTPEEIAKIQADIPEMAQELGWSEQDVWIHELGKQMYEWDAAKVGKHSLRAELVRRLDPGYYFEELRREIRIVGENFGKPWYPSPISLIRTSEHIQSAVLNTAYSRVLVWTPYDDGGPVDLLGRKGGNCKRLRFEYLDVSAAAKLVAEISDLSFEKVESRLKGEIPALSDNQGATAGSGAKVFYVKNLKRLRPQN